MSKPDSDHPSAGAASGPVSPELVLVDPDLAEIARAQLELREVPTLRREAADVSWPTHEPPPGEDPSDGDVEGSQSVAPAALDLGDVRARASRAAAAEAEARHTRKRKQRLVVVLAAIGVLAGAAAAAAVVGMTSATQDGDGASADAEQPVDSIGDVRPAPEERSPPPATVRDSPRQEQSPFVTRTFVWPSVSGAAFYRVEFFRGRRKVFEASPTKARLELPLRWSYRGRRFRLTRGKYRWEVRPAFGPRSRPRYGKPVTRSTWTAE